MAENVFRFVPFLALMQNVLLCQFSVLSRVYKPFPVNTIQEGKLSAMASRNRMH